MSRGAGAGRPSSLSWGAAWGEGMSRPQQPTTNDPLLPAGWEGQPARHPVTAGRPRQRRPQENPSPQPPGVYSQQRLFGVQTLAYLHREGGAGRARAGSLKSKTSGGRPRPGHRGCGRASWLLGPHSRPCMPSLKRRAPSPPARAGRRRKVIHSVSIHQVQEARLPPEAHGRERACPGPPRSPSTQPSQAAHADGTVGKPRRARTGST